MSSSQPKLQRLPAMLSQAEPRRSGLEDEVVELFDQMRGRLLRYLSSFRLPPMEAEEIVQEAFLALFQHLQRGRSRENLPAWLFRVAHNFALKRLQRARRDMENLSEWSDAVEKSAVDPAPSPEAEFSTAQVQKRLRSAVHALPEQDRRCLMMRAEGLRYREIAEVLNISLGGVCLSLERSLARIARAAER